MNSVPLRRPSQRGIRYVLVRLALACLLPASLGFAILFVREYLNGRDQLEQETIARARTMVQAVDVQLSRVKTAGLALTTSRVLAQNDLASFHRQARDFIAKTNVGMNVVLSDEHGQQLVNTLREFGEPLPPHGNLELLRRAISSGEPIVSDIYIGGILKKPVLSIELPIMNNGKVIHDLSVGLLPSDFNHILKSQGFPETYVAAIFDSQGTIVSRIPEKFIGEKGTAEFIQRIQQSPEGSMYTLSKEGIPTLSVWSRSPDSGWSVGIGIPRSTLEANLKHTLSWLIFWTTLLFLIGLVMVWKTGRQIADSVRALVAPAIALGQGKSVHVPEVNVRESAEVAAAIGQAAELLQARTAELTEAHRIAKFGFWQWNLKTDEMEVSDSLREIFARDIPSFGSQRGTLLPVESWEQILKAKDEVVKTGSGFDLELQVNHGNSSTIWVNAKGEALRDKNGEIVGLQGSMQDITRRKRAELDLEQARRNHLQQLEFQVAERTAALVAANHELERLGWIDALTGLQNRRSADERLRQEFLRLKRSGSPYSVLFIDIDHFKKINDTFGHETGDAVIRQIASMLAGSLRETDFVARYGGEEFLAILSHTTAEGAMTIAEKIRGTVAAEPFPMSRQVTISIGVTMALGEDKNEEEAVRRADAALYQAKDAGRNLVRFC